MNEQEKSLKLAELMGWKVEPDQYNKPLVFSGIKSKVLYGTYYEELCMYSDEEEGLAQFAAILLKFPEVMLRIVHRTTVSSIRRESLHEDFLVNPTQANILDEILRMNGINPDA